MSAEYVIDLNADLGEGAGHDEELLELVTSANVACGAHAGDDATIRRTCDAAASCGVVVGAHPGYPDRANFGRLPLALPAGALAESLTAQLATLADHADAAGTPPRYVKAHGALYHRAAADQPIADLLAATAAASQRFVTRGAVVLLGPPGAAPAAAPAGATVQAVVEGFADRAYELDAAGRPMLVDRREPGAVLAHDDAVAQALALATTGIAMTPAGEPARVHPRSICVHGDSPGAVALAREIRAELLQAGVRLEPFA